MYSQGRENAESDGFRPFEDREQHHCRHFSFKVTSQLSQSITDSRVYSIQSFADFSALATADCNIRLPLQKKTSSSGI